MNKRMKVFLGALSLVPCMTPFTALPARGQEAPVQRGAKVIYETRHDLSLPARDMVTLSRQQQREPGEHGLAPLEPFGNPYSVLPGERDSALQESEGPLVSTTNLLNFDGLTAPQSGANIPPDTNGSVGGAQFVQTVNTAYEVFDKATGASLLGPAQLNTIFSGFGGVCEGGPSLKDPVVLFDKMASRWVVSFIASADQLQTGLECVAVSTGSDATSSYSRYSFSFGNNLGDYPKLGSWPDAYYLTVKEFSSTGVLEGFPACALDRTNMLAGKPATAQCFKLPHRPPDRPGVLLPSDFDGTIPPPWGQPNFLLSISPDAPGRQLKLFKFHVDFTNAAYSTFTGPTLVTVKPYNEACGGERTCIPQKGTSQKLDSLGDRLMFRLAYRNFGDHESLVVNHSVDPGIPGIVAAVRWYEIRNPNATPTVFQQGTFSSKTTNFWMGSIAMDKNGDIALGFSASSSTRYPGIAYTGRVPTDPLGTMESTKVVFAGGGSQVGGADANSWGDYSSMAVDPSDDCTFWYTTGYLKTTGNNPSWDTGIASFKFNSCQ